MSSRKCPNCQLVNWNDVAQCARCAFPLTEDGAATGAYAPGDLASQAASGAQQRGPAQYADAPQSFAPGEATAADMASASVGAFGGDLFAYELAVAPRVAPFTDVTTGLNQAWAIYRQNFALIAKLVLFAAIPFALGQAALIYGIQDHGGSAPAYALNVLIFLFVRWSLIPPAVIYAVTKKWSTGVAPGIGESYQWAAGRWTRVMSVLLVSGLLTFLGMLLLIVPGIILSVMFALVLPVTLFEPTFGFDDVLRRSEQLTKGVRWPIFWSILLISIFASIGGGIVGAVFVGVAIFAGPTAMVLANATNVIASEVLSQLAVILALTIYLGRLTPGEQAHAINSLAGTGPAATTR